MSSSAVRSAVKQFVADNAPGEDVVDLTLAYDEVSQLISDSGIQPDSPWLGIRFIGDNEEPVGLAATNDRGKYRETGSIYFDVVDIARPGVGALLLARAEVLRNLIRGQRIGDRVVVESVSPINTEHGATLQFEGGYVSGSFFIVYHTDIDL